MLTSILMAIIGGALIGLAASGMLYMSGHIAGISGIVGGLFTPRNGDFPRRFSFLLGLLTGGIILMLTSPDVFAVPTGRPLPALIVAGLLVGFGTRLGNGCTSGHGVCGLTRKSPRSLAATLTFMAIGMIVATSFGIIQGGLS